MIPCDLDDAAADLFTQLANDPRVIVPTSELGEGFEDSLASLEASGFVKASEWGDDFTVSLTPFGATIAGLKVDPTPAADGTHRWEPADAPERPDRIKRRITPGVASLDPDTVVDRRLHEPAAVLEAEEEFSKAVRAATPTRPSLRSRLLPPRVLLTGSRPWVNPACLRVPLDKLTREMFARIDRSDSITPATPDARPDKSCRACKGLPLDDRIYCLLCHRWGLDDVLKRLRAAEILKIEAAVKRKTPKFRPHIKREKAKVGA